MFTNDYQYYSTVGTFMPTVTWGPIFRFHFLQTYRYHLVTCDTHAPELLSDDITKCCHHFSDIQFPVNKTPHITPSCAFVFVIEDLVGLFSVSLIVPLHLQVTRKNDSICRTTFAARRLPTSFHQRRYSCGLGFGGL